MTFKLGIVKVESNENKLTAVPQQAKTREMKINYHAIGIGKCVSK